MLILPEGKNVSEVKKQHNQGFTLVEVMAVVVILAVLAAVAIPKLTSAGETARVNADIATGHQVKLALDRYQVENGVYPTIDEMDDSVSNGEIVNPNFIPLYISKLDKSTTQQRAADDVKGFGVKAIPAGWPDTTPTHLIMVYLTTDGSAAEVCTYNSDLSQVLWTSAN
ncbi:type II secretion system protein [Paradesulfitobacterium ferrireducens]|uniref:type II secretion system protein n=1 Tax=Paradesulfitobacterium ferrireducens TaxID=2816476 RepID=UPI001A8C4697|nr:prepilin-type N-terminal cleavage/methylation domain-containing protein [Paradesulfitobacterium ferrireducens]